VKTAAAAPPEGETPVSDDPKKEKISLSTNGPLVVSHLTLLQGVVNRLSTSSASCKTWCLTLVGSMVSVAGMTRTPAIVTGALVPIFIFGFADTMYLSQERAYRDLYASIVKKIHDGDYALGDTFNAEAKTSSATHRAALRSWAILPVYGGLLAFYVLAHYAGWLALLEKPSP